jgi:Glycosyltransferase family 9 (heptosyltransferase)
MPDAWTSAMLDGAFEAAWRISDAVLRERAGQSAAHLPPHLRWLWEGTPLAGRRVLVRCWHGLGDTIQFIRFIPRLAHVARSVAVEAQAELLPLLRPMAGIDALLPLGAAPPDFDLEIESMELAHALRLSLEDLPGRVPYLKPPRPARPRARRDRLGVGVAWQAGDWRRGRSLPPALLAPLARLGIDTIGLVPGAAEPWLQAAIAMDTEIAETAALLQQLDLVISVDTMVAHLAGALARPTWLLLDAEADWRWMRRADSVWYPTMRLFRQQRPGAWAPVVARVIAELAALARAERRASPPRSEGRRIPFAARTGDGGA